MASTARRDSSCEFLWGGERDPRPFLELAVDRYLSIARERGLDTGRCVIALPGSRAQRGVEELLAERAPAELEPPRVVTEGALPQVLSSELIQFASEWQRALAWRVAILGAPKEVRAELWGGDLDSVPV